MERSRSIPALVRPEEVDPDRPALIVAQGTDDAGRHHSPFARLTWRLVLTAGRTRSSHGLA